MANKRSPTYFIFPDDCVGNKVSRTAGDHDPLISKYMVTYGLLRDAYVFKADYVYEQRRHASPNSFHVIADKANGIDTTHEYFDERYHLPDGYETMVELPDDLVCEMKLLAVEF